MNTKSVLTHSDRVDLIRRYDRETLVDLWRTSFGAEIDSALTGLTEVNLHRCRDSGLEFFTPPNVAGDSDFYAHLAGFNWYYPTSRWDLDESLKLAADAQNLLEIGSGEGNFLRRWLKVAAPNSKCLGVEINKDAAELAASNGLPVTTRSLTDMVNEHAGQFDFVCAFQVLEHLADPKTFFEQVCSLLSPNGTLILSVPNRDCSLGLEKNPLDYPPHHMSRWSAETFSNVSKFYPLELRDVLFQPLMRDEYDRLLSTLSNRSTWLRGLLKLPGSRRLARALLGLGGSKVFSGQSIIAHYQRRS